MAGDFADKTATKSLNQNHDINSDADAMVRICEVSVWTDSDEAENEDDGAEADSEDLKVCMISDGVSRLARVESGNEDGNRDNEEEGDGGYHSVAENKTVILGQGRETIAHAIVLHSLKVETLEIGKQERVLFKVPSSIAHVHGIGRVRARPGR